MLIHISLSSFRQKTAHVPYPSLGENVFFVVEFVEFDFYFKFFVSAAFCCLKFALLNPAYALILHAFYDITGTAYRYRIN